MTASSSNDDLADLLGNLAENEEAIDENLLAEIDGAAALAEQGATAETATESTHSEPVTETVAEAEADPAAAFVAEADDTEPDDTEVEAQAADSSDDYADALAAAVGGESVPEESEAAAQFADVMGNADEADAAPVAAITAAPVSRKRRVTEVAKGDGMKATMAPILLTVGLLVLVPAVWGTMLLTGMDVFMSERGNAKTMATFMMLCWPIAVALIATAIVLFMQVSKTKKKAAARA